MIHNIPTEKFWIMTISVMIIVSGFIGIAQASKMKAIDGYRIKEKYDNGWIFANTYESVKYANAKTYFWTIISQSDYNQFLDFLNETDWSDMKVYAVIVTPTEGTSQPYRHDFIAWARHFANLSLKHPQLIGYTIDDMGYDLAHPSNSEKFFNLTYVYKMQDAKNAINPKLQFVAQIYNEMVNFTLDDFNYKFSLPSNTRSHKGEYLGITQSIEVPSEFNSSSDTLRIKFKILDTPETMMATGYHFKQLLVNGRVVWEDDIVGNEGNIVINEDISQYVSAGNTSNITIRLYEKGEIWNYPTTIWVGEINTTLNGQEIDSNWTEIHNGKPFVYEEGLHTSYKPYIDGLLFTPRRDPDNSLLLSKINNARLRLGNEKPLYILIYSLKTYNGITITPEYLKERIEIARNNSDGVMLWGAPLYVYEDLLNLRIYAQTPNDNPDYDYKFSFPSNSYTKSGWYHAIEHTVDIPVNMTSIVVNFTIEDNQKSPNYVYYLKQLLVNSKIVWEYDNVGEEGTLKVSQDITSYVTAGTKINLTLRVYANTTIYNSQIKVYVTEPNILINSNPITSNWTFDGGNVNTDNGDGELYKVIKEAYSTE